MGDHINLEPVASAILGWEGGSFPFSVGSLPGFLGPDDIKIVGDGGHDLVFSFR